jgi:hypothetical protein
MRTSQLIKSVMPLSTDVQNHRLGAYIYGFLGGMGLIMIIWGLNSIAFFPSINSVMTVGLVFFGVLCFAASSCREAYIRGNLSASSEAYRNRMTNSSEEGKLTAEQIITRPVEDELREPTS